MTSVLLCYDFRGYLVQFRSVGDWFVWGTEMSSVLLWYYFRGRSVQFGSVYCPAGSSGRQRWVLFCSDMTFAVVQFNSAQFIARLVRRGDRDEFCFTLIWLPRLFSYLTDMVVGGTLKTIQQRWLLFCSDMTFAVVQFSSVQFIERLVRRKDRVDVCFALILLSRLFSSVRLSLLPGWFVGETEMSSVLLRYDFRGCSVHLSFVHWPTGSPVGWRWVPFCSDTSFAVDWVVNIKQPKDSSLDCPLGKVVPVSAECFDRHNCDAVCFFR